jgi:hypothetical protein
MCQQTGISGLLNYRPAWSTTLAVLVFIKFSCETYIQHQLLTLPLLKKYLSEDFWDTIELTEIMDVLRETIHLDEVPHFTTIHKFCQQIRTSLFTQLLNRLMKVFYDWREKIYFR